MNFCQRCRADLGEYLDGTLSASDREKVAAHLETCPDCQKELHELELTRSALQSWAPVAAPSDLRLRVRSALEKEPQRQQSTDFLAFFDFFRPKPMVWSGALTLSAVALLFLTRNVTLEVPENSAPPESVPEKSALPSSKREKSSVKKAEPQLPTAKRSQQRAAPSTGTPNTGTSNSETPETGPLEDLLTSPNNRSEAPNQGRTLRKRQNPTTGADGRSRRPENGQTTGNSVPPRVSSAAPPSVASTRPSDSITSGAGQTSPAPEIADSSPAIKRMQVSPPISAPASKPGRVAKPELERSMTLESTGKAGMAPPRIASSRFSFEITEQPNASVRTDDRLGMSAANSTAMGGNALEQAPSTFAVPAPIAPAPMMEKSVDNAAPPAPQNRFRGNDTQQGAPAAPQNFGAARRMAPVTPPVTNPPVAALPKRREPDGVNSRSIM
ncbi:hypothetical protein EON80_13710, partial [bacterium]